MNARALEVWKNNLYVRQRRQFSSKSCGFYCQFDDCVNQALCLASIFHPLEGPDQPPNMLQVSHHLDPAQRLISNIYIQNITSDGRGSGQPSSLRQ